MKLIALKNTCLAGPSQKHELLDRTSSPLRSHRNLLPNDDREMRISRGARQPSLRTRSPDRNSCAIQSGVKWFLPSGSVLLPEIQTQATKLLGSLMIHTGESNVLNTTQQLKPIEPPNHTKGREGEGCVLWMLAAGARQERRAATAWESRDDAATGSRGEGSPRPGCWPAAVAEAPEISFQSGEENGGWG